MAVTGEILFWMLVLTYALTAPLHYYLGKRIARDELSERISLQEDEILALHREIYSMIAAETKREPKP